MTDPSDMQHEPETEATPDPEPEVRPEVIKDLDVTSDDADVIAGGCPQTSCHYTQWD
jgi:hypothetical protein